VSGPFAPDLLIENIGTVRLVTINRPETLNAVSAEIHTALSQVWRHLAADVDARAIVITGAGRAFSAGGDFALMERAQNEPDERLRQTEEAGTIFREQLMCPLPIVAAVNGPAVGLGCSISVLSDLVVMSEDAFLSDPHVPVGLTAADGGAAAWPLVVGMLRAKEYVLLGSKIPADEALRIGLANRVVASDVVLDEAMALGERLAALPPQALRSTKRALNMHLQRAAAGVLDYALAAEYHSFDTPEHREITSKFLAKAS